MFFPNITIFMNRGVCDEVVIRFELSLVRKKVHLNFLVHFDCRLQSKL